MAHGDWSTWMKWKREESKKHKVKAKVDMYFFVLFLRRLLGLLPLLA